MLKREMHLLAAGLVAALLLAFFLGSEKDDLTAKVYENGGQGPEIMLHLDWGSGPADAGRRMDPESAPEGPMSFSVAQGGEIYILDQVNLRILGFDGSGALAVTLPLSGDTFQDMEVAEDGRIVLLDRLARGEVVVLDPAGRETAAHAVAGPGIQEGGGVTAMFLEQDGLWLEYNHERIVRILDASLQPCARTVLKGRKAGTGHRTVWAALAGQGRVDLELIDRATGSAIAHKQIDFGPDLLRIAWMQADGPDSIFLMVHLAAAGSGTPVEKIRGLRLDAKLEQAGSFESPVTIRVWEQFREFRVLPAGSVFQMAFTDSGVDILRWRALP